MAYRADIEIAVRGAAQITNLQKQLQGAASGVDLLNSRLRSGAVPSINNFNAVVTQSDRVLRAAAQGTRVQKDAIDVYVRSVAAAEKAEKSLQNAIQKRRQELNISALTKTGASGGAGKGISGRIGGSISSATIGGAFPLLFGQGPQAAIGGAVGGLLGGAGGGFAGSLLGTLIGDLAAARQNIKDLGNELNFTGSQITVLDTAFQQAGKNSDALTAAIQNIRGLGLSIEEQASAIAISSELAKQYSGRVEKIAQAFADTLESGKVSIGTLSKLTGEGIPIQDKLAIKYDVSKTKLLEMAKEGKISVQDLVNQLLILAKEAENAPNKGKKSFDNFKDSVYNLGVSIQSLAEQLLRILGPAIDFIVTKATAGLQTLATLLQGGASADFMKGFASLRGGATSQGVDNLNSALDKLNVSAPKTAAQTKKALQEITAAQTLLSQKITPEDPNKEKSEDLQKRLLETKGSYIKQAKQQLAAERSVLKPITVQTQLPPVSSAAKTVKDDTAKKAAELALFVKNTRAETEYLQVQETISQKIFEAEQKRDPLLVARLQGEEKLAAIQYDYAQQLATATTEVARQVITEKGLVAQKNAVAEAARNQQKIQAEISKNTADTLASLDLELALKQATTEEERQRLQIAYDMARLQGQMPNSDIAKIKAKREQLAAPESAGQIASKRMGALSDELRELTNLGNIAVKVADGIGTAFGQAFQGLIDGSMTAREALGSFFKSVGEMFVSMAVEIIAKQMTMIVLGLIMKALGLGASASSGGLGAGGNSFNANGAVPAGMGNIPSIPSTFGPSASGSFSPIKFADGGVFGSPTLFKFADGGATRTGLMGEAGPEAIMPLKRDGSGRLGVNASGLRDAMAGGNSGGGGGTTLNMSFETTSIGGVEYVSRNQLEAAMAQTRKDATRDGAKKGMSMTIDRLQQSPQTRSRVGMR